MEDPPHGLTYRLSSIVGSKPVSKLLEGGHLITTHHPHYLPPASIPGYGGHCPGYNFRTGKTHADNFCVFQKDKREDTFRNGFRMKPGTLMTYYRKPQRYKHEKIEARLTHVDYVRYHKIFSLYEKGQDYRDYYRDLTGTLPIVKKFQIPKTNQDGWKPQYPLESYYMHYNMKPETKVNFFDRFHSSHLYGPRPKLNYDANPLKHALYGTQ